VDRAALATTAVVVGSTLAGFVLSVFVFESDSPITAGLLGTGGGAMIGSFIAAIATDEPLLGGRTDMAAKTGPRPTAPDDRTRDGHDPTKAL
jgi:hypothetical protein